MIAPIATFRDQLGEDKHIVPAYIRCFGSMTSQTRRIQTTRAHIARGMVRPFQISTSTSRHRERMNCRTCCVCSDQRAEETRSRQANCRGVARDACSLRGRGHRRCTWRWSTRWRQRGVAHPSAECHREAVPASRSRQLRGQDLKGTGDYSSQTRSVHCTIGNEASNHRGAHRSCTS